MKPKNPRNTNSRILMNEPTAFSEEQIMSNKSKEKVSFESDSDSAD